MALSQLEHTDYIHRIFEEVQGAGSLGVYRCHEIRDTLKRAKDTFPRRHHKFLKSIVNHVYDLEDATSALDTKGALPPGKNPARSKMALEKREQLEWFANNAKRTHKLITRSWSDLRTWTMNLLLSVGMFVLGALATYFVGCGLID